MSATVQEIVDDALELVGEVAGSGVQQYGEDRMFDNTVRGFNLMFKKYPWHQFRQWFRLELDGILGVVSTDAFEQVKDFEDFFFVGRDAERQPMPLMAKAVNPYTLGSGTKAVFWTSLHSKNVHYRKRRLQFYPATAVGFVNVGTLLYPLEPPALEWDWEDIMDLDKDLLVYASAFMTLVSDDLTANAAGVVKGMMDDKYTDVLAAIGRKPVGDTPTVTVPDQWFTV